MVADPEHVEILRAGVAAWNRWRDGNPDTRPSLASVNLNVALLVDANLSGADLREATLAGALLTGADLSGAELVGADLTAANMVATNLEGADLRGVNLSGTQFTGANMVRARLADLDLQKVNLATVDLSHADLSGTNLGGVTLSVGKLVGANLWRAYLAGAILSDTDLSGANLGEAVLTGATLTRATLTRANLVGAQLSDASIDDADISNARVYGVGAWNIRGTPRDQTNLVIEAVREGGPSVTVDDLELAQFMYLILHNDRLRRVIDTITSKVVLILGRFTDDRKAVLDALRIEIRRHNLTPVLFDFDMPADRDITETVTLLARMARFIIADLSDPASIPMELQAIAPDVAVPIRSIIHTGQEPFSMFRTLAKYHWVLPPYQYDDLDDLLANLDTQVIAPAEAKRAELHPVSVLDPR